MIELTEAPTLERYLIAELSVVDFKRSIRAQVRSLLFGHTDEFGFTDNMLSAMERAFERAWQEGAADCGIGPDERTAEEATALNNYVNTQATFIPGFARRITQARDDALANDEKITQNTGGVLSQASMWANRYNEVVSMAKTMACGDKKQIWVLGPTEHCGDCSKLAGKVKRGSVWVAADIRTQSPRLECGGFNCQCQLKPTDAKATPGRLPALSG